MKKISYFFYALAALSVLTGFHKFFFYENSDSYRSSDTNAYVGGDAYNYIINSGYMTAFFVLAVVFVLIANHIFNIAMYEERHNMLIDLKNEAVESVSKDIQDLQKHNSN